MGAQLRVYKQKIASAQTTKKITKAMELIAASRIQKAMARVRASSPFARAVTRAVSAVATHSNVQHPLTTEREVIRRSAVVIFASDRGLAGAFNSQILREGLQLGELLRSQGKGFYCFLAHCNTAPFDNVDLRMALKFAIDRQEILIVSVIAVIVRFPELSIGHSRRFMLFLFARRRCFHRCWILWFLLLGR